MNAKDLPIRFYVANHKAECTGVAVQKCLLLKNSLNGEWKNHYGNIEGFDYEEGYDYEILVNKKVVVNPPADGSSFVLILSSVEKKIPTMLIKEDDKKFLENRNFICTRIRIEKKMIAMKDNKLSVLFDLLNNKISGKDGCNTFQGNININNYKISFSQFAKTEMMCQNITVDKDFYKAIESVDNYKIFGNFFRLYKGKKLILEYIQQS